MIVINSLEEIDKYKTEERYIEEKDCNYICYVFKENNQLQDVEFNISISLSFDDQLDNLINNEMPYNEYCFIAKNVKMNISSRFYELIADNLESKGICDIEHLKIKQNITADVLSARYISAKSIEASSIIVADEINCEHIKAKKFCFNNQEFVNIDCDIRKPKEIL